MPTPIRWACPPELTAEEARVAQALHRIGKFFVFLREVRAELFDEAFQAELAAAYQPRGTAPVPPALLAMVTLLQAYDQLGDADAVVTAQMDKRWQLVLGCLGATNAPFSQGVLVKCRAPMIAHDLDWKLLARTIELAKRTGTCGWQRLQAARDSSPLLGAGRIEDTWNLIGRALSAVVTCAAKAVDRPRAQVIAEADLTLVARSSLKAALDIDWDDPAAHAAALERLLMEVDRIEQWVAAQPATIQATPALQAALTALRAVLHAKPWTARNGERFPKHAFAIRLADGVVECPAQQTAPIVPGRATAQCAADTCRACALRQACTTAAEGRSISLHPQEALLQQLRATTRTPEGRAVLRRRTTVEHSLARLDRIQGKKARYKGVRKNTLDVRRCAAVANLQRLARLKPAA